jgi:hypothetical protein
MDEEVNRKEMRQGKEEVSGSKYTLSDSSGFLSKLAHPSLCNLGYQKMLELETAAHRLSIYCMNITNKQM